MKITCNSAWGTWNNITPFRSSLKGNECMFKEIPFIIKLFQMICLAWRERNSNLSCSQDNLLPQNQTLLTGVLVQHCSESSLFLSTQRSVLAAASSCTVGTQYSCHSQFLPLNILSACHHHFLLFTVMNSGSPLCSSPFYSLHHLLTQARQTLNQRPRQSSSRIGPAKLARKLAGLHLAGYAISDPMKWL